MLGKALLIPSAPQSRAHQLSSPKKTKGASSLSTYHGTTYLKRFLSVNSTCSNLFETLPLCQLNMQKPETLPLSQLNMEQPKGYIRASRPALDKGKQASLGPVLQLAWTRVTKCLHPQHHAREVGGRGNTGQISVSFQNSHVRSPTTPWQYKIGCCKASSHSPLCLIIHRNSHPPSRAREVDGCGRQASFLCLIKHRTTTSPTMSCQGSRWARQTGPPGPM